MHIVLPCVVDTIHFMIYHSCDFLNLVLNRQQLRKMVHLDMIFIIGLAKIQLWFVINLSVLRQLLSFGVLAMHSVLFADCAVGNKLGWIWYCCDQDCWTWCSPWRACCSIPWSSRPWDWNVLVLLQTMYYSTTRWGSIWLQACWS